MPLKRGASPVENGSDEAPESGCGAARCALPGGGPCATLKVLDLVRDLAQT